MNARRLPALVALGLLGPAALGLAACRADPAVAAYVGEVRITEAEVDAVIAGLRTVAGGSIEPELAAVRPRVVEMRVLTEVGRGYAEQAGLTVPEPARDQVAASLGLPAGNAYAELVATFLAVMDALRGSVEPVPPTEADQREVYDHLVAGGLAVPFEQVQVELDEQVLGEPVAMRNLLAEAVDRTTVHLNPRYLLVYRVPVPLGNTQSWLDLPLGDSAVVDSG
jgi:hypothetical protein